MNNFLFYLLNHNRVLEVVKGKIQEVLVFLLSYLYIQYDGKRFKITSRE